MFCILYTRISTPDFRVGMGGNEYTIVLVPNERRSEKFINGVIT